LSTDGLKGNAAWGGGVTLESFRAPASYDASEGMLYIVSSNVGNYPIDGALYKINALTGVTQAYTACNGVNLYHTPVIDQSAIYLATYASWVGPINGQFQAFRKSDLVLSYSIAWVADYPADAFPSAPMFLTCEPDGRADIAFMFDRTGHLHVVDVDAGVELFSRRISEVAYGGAGGAIGLDVNGDPHVILESALGGVFDLTPQAVRARMAIVNPSTRAAVPFGNDANYPVTFEEVFTNMGCLDLTTQSTFPTYPMVRR